MRLPVTLDTFENLVKDGVFETMFLLHKVRGRPAQKGPEGGDLREEAKLSLSVSGTQGEKDLKRTWARWRNMFQPQPIDKIR